MDFTGEDHQKDQGTVGRGLSTSSYCSGCCVYGLANAARDIKAPSKNGVKVAKMERVMLAGLTGRKRAKRCPRVMV